MLDLLRRKHQVFTCTLADQNTSTPLAPTEVLVNPDGPSAADFIAELCTALVEAQIYVDDCFGRSDQAFSERIDSLIRRAGLE